MNKKWIALYTLIAAGALVSYFTAKNFLIYSPPTSIIISNLTFNLLVMTMTWGAAGSWWLRKKPFLIKWSGVLAGFVLILIILTITGTHTRITDLLGGKM